MLKRKPRNKERRNAGETREMLDNCLKIKKEIKEELKDTEDLETYDILIKQYHDTLELESKCKEVLKQNLRNNN